LKSHKITIFAGQIQLTHHTSPWLAGEIPGNPPFLAGEIPDFPWRCRRPVGASRPEGTGVGGEPRDV